MKNIILLFSLMTLLFGCSKDDEIDTASPSTNVPAIPFANSMDFTSIKYSFGGENCDTYYDININKDSSLTY
jgi:hypothetical protein